MITRDDHLGALEEIRDVTHRAGTNELRLRFVEMFWARRCLELAEQAHVASERLRFRVQDQETMRFYAYDSPDSARNERDVAHSFLQSAARYTRLSQWLISCVHEGHEWANAEVARMRAKSAAPPAPAAKRKKGKHGASAAKPPKKAKTP